MIPTYLQRSGTLSQGMGPTPTPLHLHILYTHPPIYLSIRCPLLKRVWYPHPYICIYYIPTHPPIYLSYLSGTLSYKGIVPTPLHLQRSGTLSQGIVPRTNTPTPTYLYVETRYPPTGHGTHIPTTPYIGRDPLTG